MHCELVGILKVREWWQVKASMRDQALYVTASAKVKEKLDNSK